MEGVPRLPMVSFVLKISPDRPPVDFGKLRQYIRDFYNEDPDTYSTEIRNLESLRAQAVHPVKDVTGCSLLKKYYCQLHFLQSRFPMCKDGAAAVSFTWKDTYSSMVCSLADIQFEIVAILYNIGALHSLLGAADDRTTPEGLKLACTHFQCAAWAFQHLKDSYPQPSGVDLSTDLMQFMYHLCLAQAQECILEKSVTDNRKATINAKVAAQIVDYYNLALNALLQGPSDEGSIMDTVSSKLYKSWKKYTRFKSTYYSCISLLYLGMQSEEQQKMGERVGFFQAAVEKLNEAIKIAKGIENSEAINETSAFTRDVVEGKRKAAKNENEFIYHEEVPDADSLPTVKGASLVKGIAFNVNDPDISGPDIFARLVPMKAHEASSLYSEEKAKLLRRISGLIDAKDEEVVSFMSCLQLEHIKAHLDQTVLPQEIVDRCAALSARPDAIPNLMAVMDKLNDAYNVVDGMLKEINNLIKEEEVAEKDYQEIMGSRPPSIVATDMTREANKYMEAHKKAAESNETLHRAMMQHIENLKVLQQPLSDLQAQLPSLAPLNLSENQSLKEVLMLVGKVEEMRRQRAMLACQLRESICSDDITTQLVTRASENMETIFQQEMQKHNRYVSVIEQNLAAQDNILPALTDAYANYAPTRKATAEVIRQRDMTLSALISSYDAYEDLIAKSAKGLEFYRKLETNLTKLLQRVKGTCKVQQEERDTILSKNGKTPLQSEYSENLTTGSGLKLKDYLNKKAGQTPILQSGAYYNHNYGSQNTGEISSGNESQNWMPGVRPTPVGSEGTAPVCSSTGKPFNPDTQTYSSPSNSAYASQSQALPYQPYSMEQQQAYHYQISGSYCPQSYSYPSQPLQTLQYPSLADHNYAAVEKPHSSPSHNQESSYISNPIGPSGNSDLPRVENSQNTPYTPQHQYQNTVTYQTPSQSYYSLAGGNETSPSPPTFYQPQASVQQLFSPGSGTTSIYSYNNPQMTQMPQIETTASQTASQGYNAVYTSNTSTALPTTVSLGMPQQIYNQNAFSAYQSGSTAYNLQYASAGSMQQPQYASAGSMQQPQYASAGSMQQPHYASAGSVQQHHYASAGSMQQPQYASTSVNTKSQTGYDTSPAFNSQQNQFSSVDGTLKQHGQYVNPQSNYVPLSTPSNQTYQYGITQSHSAFTSANLNQQSQYSQATSISNQASATTCSSNQTSFQNSPTVNQNTQYAVNNAHQLQYAQPVEQASNLQYASNINSNTGAVVQQNYSASLSSAGSLGTKSVEGVSQGEYYNQYGYNYSTSGTQQSYQQYPTTGTYYDPSAQYLSTQKNMQPSIQGHTYVGQGTPSANYNSYYSHPYSGYSTMSSSIESPINSPAHATTTSQVISNSGSSIKSTQPALPPVSNQSQPSLPSSTGVKGREGSNVDLLAGLDFTVNEVPLQPQQDTDKKISQSQELMSELTLEPSPSSLNDKNSCENNEETKPQDQYFVEGGNSLKLEKPLASKQPAKDPLSDPESLSQFVQEVEKFEKFVDGLTVKTLNGPTPLDLKWNELQDLQEKDVHKLSISVARCYPMKNRFPDILPYDNTRVELPSTKDDYINASVVKVLGPACPNFILTQAPLPSTYADFWIMVLEHHIELIVCLLADNQMNGEIYWPPSKGEDLILGKVKVVLQSCNIRSHWVERIMSVTDGKLSRVVVHLEFTAWPQRWFPESPGPFLSLVSESLSVWGEGRGRGSVVVHCDAGTGRSGVFALLTVAVSDLRSSSHLPDLVLKAALLALSRKNPLRDREYLRFAFQALLYHAQDLLMKRGILASRSTFEEKRTKSKSHTRHPSEDFLLNPLREPGQLSSEDRRSSDASSTGSFKPGEADPLSQIDPLWPIKRYS